MCFTNLLKLLPMEISITIFRNFFTFDEKVNVLKDDYFWSFLSDPCAWREKPKIPWVTLKGASAHLLNEIECGYYGKDDSKKIYKVSKNAKRGSVIVEEFEHVTDIAETSSNKKRFVMKEFLPINQVQSAFRSLKSKYKVLSNDIFTDRLGCFIVDLDLKCIKDLPYHTLLQIDKNPFFIYKKHRYLFLIAGNETDDQITCFSSDTEIDNSELLHLVCQMEYTNCKNCIQTKNFTACKIFPWRKCFKFTMKTTFNYMFRKKMIKVTTAMKYYYHYVYSIM